MSGDIITPLRRGSSLQGPAQDLESVERIALVIAVVGALGLFWLPTLRWGLMTDEFLSAWITSDGIDDAVGRAQRFQGNSPLYFVMLWGWRQIAGGSEFALRLPSVVATIAAGYHLWRLGREMDRSEAGLIAAFVFVSSSNIVVRATTARPYGLLLLLVVVSVRSLWRWIEEQNRRDGILWMASLVGAVYLTPFAAPMALVHLLIINDAHRNGRAPAARPMRRLLGWGAVACLPLVPQLVDLAGRSTELITSTQPGIDGLIDALAPVGVLAGIGAGLLAGGFARRSPLHADRGFRAASFWAVVPPVVLYGMGELSGSAVWPERYRAAAVPGLALCVGMVVVRFGHRARAVALCALLLVTMMDVGGWVGTHRHGWRETIDWVDAEIGDEGDSVVALGVNLIEATDPELFEDEDWAAYLTSSTDYYEISAPVVGLPRGATERARAHVDALFAAGRFDHDTVAVIDGANGVPAPDYLTEFRVRLGALGYVETPGPVTASVTAAIFRRVS